MASSKWKTWQELQEATQGKKVVFWGASNWVERTLNHIQLDVAYIVDKSKLNQGITYCNFLVEPPEKLLQEDSKSIFVIIATANYMSVIDDISKFGFIMGEDYCCTPLLNQRKDKDDLMNHQQTIVVSSPQHFSSDTAGGGLYTYAIHEDHCQKVFSGKCRGITKKNDNYFVIDMLRGIMVLDRSFKEVGLFDLKQNTEPHGLCLDEDGKHLFVAQPGRDSVAIYDVSTGKAIEEIFLSEKWARNKKDNHHLNDLYVEGNSLYISLFSFSGNWLHEVYDGGILEYDLEQHEFIGPVISGQWMPHSVHRYEGRLMFLNSMLGELWAGSQYKLGTFPGFVRGLDYDGKYYYIGTTEHRYPEKLKGQSLNIMLDTGFYAFDINTKMSRFFKMNMVETIHSLIVA